MSWTDQCPAQATGIDLKLGFSACQSHMTAMMAMPPVVPVNHRPLRAVTHVIAMIDAEDAFHAADDAADCCANHRADRASDAVALIEAMRSAAGNALCLCGERHRKRYEKQAGNKQVLFHEVIPFEVRGFRRHDGTKNWLSTPLKKCIGSPEQKYISDAGKKAPELGAFSSGIRLGWDYPPAGPSRHGVSGACSD